MLLGNVNLIKELSADKEAESPHITLANRVSGMQHYPAQNVDIESSSDENEELDPETALKKKQILEKE